MPSTQDARKKFRRFRILVVGRANSGKTTLLQKVCSATEKPQIFDGKGKKIDADILKTSVDRGYHDINNELVFRSTPGFVFHDSCGFGAGDEDEFKEMKQFISERASMKKLNDRIHAIWYCIPMDEYHRAMTMCEKRFFSECDISDVPVIAVFTKFDALSAVALRELRRIPGLTREDLFERIPKRVKVIFAHANVWGRLCETRHPPKGYVCLAKMNIDETDCGPLLECTMGALGDEALLMLLISTQTNLELSITHAAKKMALAYIKRARQGSFKHEDSDEHVAFVDASLSAARLSSPASVVQNVAPAALPSHHQQQERHDAPPSSMHVQAELDVSVLLQDLTKYITKVGDYAVARGGFGEI
ncbi:hypothetical protein M405DRAFT_810957 [Rhizopogon salebrosus TDB-379]|nr:hypothetical protein M405DRAFT_810957 [Rhizopogon salebrosus TDB-379]